MTGKIKIILNDGSATGYIEAETGQSVFFDSAAMLAYDVASLAVGQLVTFDVEGTRGAKAINICIQRRQQQPLRPDEKRPGTSRVLYVGFDQKEGIRAYRFERVSTGEETENFVLSADMAMFRKHAIGIQEGPALCLRVLMEELAAAGATRRPWYQRSLNEQDMLFHIGSKPLPGSKHRARRPATIAAAV